MERKTVSGVILSLLLMSISTLAFNLQPVEAEPTTWTVDDDGPADFSSIQQAINSPLVAAGDTIFVYSGTYYENVIIDKTVSLIGMNPINTIVDGGGSGDVISVKANNTAIENLTVRNSGSSANYGIRLARVNNCNIKNNRITSNSRGLYFDSSSNNSISENNITDNRRGIAMGEGPWGTGRSNSNSIYRNNITSNGECGMFLAWAYSNSIYENSITNNGGWMGIWGGILIIMSVSNNISRNNITANHGAGIFNAGEYYARNNLISGNIIANNSGGIYLNYASGNVISANQIANNSDNGVSLVSSTWGGYMNHDNTIFGNSIKANSRGIFLFTDSPIGSACRTYNNIVNANIVANNDYGVYLSGVLPSDNNALYHNDFVDNAYQVYIGRLGDGSVWDDYYPSGGNFWSDYAGIDLFSGSDQNLPGSDGIGDTPYVIDANNRDRYPLMKPWAPTEALEELIETIEAWNLPKGTENSLTPKLEDALHLLDKGNENGARHKLMDFINQVEALRDKKLTEEQADFLVSEAQRIIDLIKE